jgi:ankyrin repeat protein
MAAESGHKAMMRLLLEKGADVDAKANDGSTVLHWAVARAVVRCCSRKGSTSLRMIVEARRCTGRPRDGSAAAARERGETLPLYIMKRWCTPDS